jgi:hypothetical protein
MAIYGEYRITERGFLARGPATVNAMKLHRDAARTIHE